MSRTTKLELQQALATLGEEVQALRLRVSQLTADNERLLGAAKPQATEPPAAKPQATSSQRDVVLSAARAAYLARRAERQAQSAEAGATPFQLACQRARQMAVASGRVVKVGA